VTVLERESKSVPRIEVATLAAGCFWCTEAVFQRIKGVKSVSSGYSGGTKKNPTYEDVCSGKTGHAEVLQIRFDPRVISFSKILDVFWEMHDPTSLNRQGADEGTQYRSAIFYHDKKQREIAEKSKLKASNNFDREIVTEIVPFDKFYKAENDHVNYYNNNSRAPYCMLVISPKLRKLGLK